VGRVGSGRVGSDGVSAELEVLIETGRIAIHVPWEQDRGAHADGWRLRFNTLLVPLHLREAKSVEKLLPWLYLNSLSTGNLSKALASLLRPDADGLSTSTFIRLKSTW
jgi:putative transposase